MAKRKEAFVSASDIILGLGRGADPETTSFQCSSTGPGQASPEFFARRLPLSLDAAISYFGT